jgi:hypothetical protein
MVAKTTSRMRAFIDTDNVIVKAASVRLMVNAASGRLRFVMAETETLSRKPADTLLQLRILMPEAKQESESQIYEVCSRSCFIGRKHGIFVYAILATLRIWSRYTEYLLTQALKALHSHFGLRLTSWECRSRGKLQS